jgi:hypothetical protein
MRDLTPPYFANHGNDDEWDLETGKPGINLFASAVQVWSASQNREAVTIRQTAVAFNVPDQMIITAVRHHYWMNLLGDPRDPAHCIIEHEGA